MTASPAGHTLARMARIARIVLAGAPHLLCQRGSRGGRLFFSSGDRQRYLEIVRACFRSCGVKLWAYRLTGREVLMVAVPAAPEALGAALRNAHGRYSQFVNRRQKTAGHLFQGRFYSCPLDEDSLALAVRHVERFRGVLPAGTVSSAGHHCDRRRPGGPLADDLPLLKTVRNWRRWLAEPIGRAEVAYLLSRLRVGKPAGSPKFVRRVERLTGLNLSRPRGRPRKRKAAGR